MKIFGVEVRSSLYELVSIVELICVLLNTRIFCWNQWHLRLLDELNGVVEIFGLV